MLVSWRAAALEEENDSIISGSIYNGESDQTEASRVSSKGSKSPKKVILLLFVFSSPD